MSNRISLGQLLVDYKTQQQNTEIDSRPTINDIMTMARVYNVEKESDFTIYLPKEGLVSVVDRLTGLATDVSLRKYPSNNTTIISVDTKRVKDITTLMNMLDGISEFASHKPAEDKLFVALVNGSDIDDIVRMEEPA